MTDRTHLSSDQAQAIAGNTRLMTESFSELTDEDMTPGRAGVAYLDGFITRQRERGDAAQRARLADMAGCYLGEAMLAVIGGRWVQDPEHGVGIEMAQDFVAYPFAKAAKHFANGPTDSVLSFLDVAVMIAAERRSKAAPG